MNPTQNTLHIRPFTPWEIKEKISIEGKLTINKVKEAAYNLIVLVGKKIGNGCIHVSNFFINGWNRCVDWTQKVSKSSASGSANSTNPAPQKRKADRGQVASSEKSSIHTTATPLRSGASPTLPSDSGKGKTTHTETFAPIEVPVQPEANSANKVPTPVEPKAATPAPAEPEAKVASRTPTPAPVETETKAESRAATPAPAEPEAKVASRTPTPAPVETETKVESRAATPAPAEPEAKVASRTPTPAPVETETKVESRAATPTPAEPEAKVASRTPTPAPVETETKVESRAATPAPAEPEAKIASRTPTPAPVETETKVESRAATPAPAEPEAKVASRTPTPAPVETETKAESRAATPAPAEPEAKVASARTSPAPSTTSEVENASDLSASQVTSQKTVDVAAPVLTSDTTKPAEHQAAINIKTARASLDALLALAPTKKNNDASSSSEEGTPSPVRSVGSDDFEATNEAAQPKARRNRGLVEVAHPATV